MSETVTITTTTGESSSEAGSGAGNTPGSDGIFIVDGVITTTATPAQRNAARSQRFPGTGHLLGDTESLSPSTVTAIPGGGGDPPPPGGTVTAEEPSPPSVHIIIRPSTGPGHLLGGRDLMDENREWGMTRSESMADVYRDRLSRIAMKGPGFIAEFQTAFGELFAAHQRQAQRPRPSVDPCNPCSQHSLLPRYTPVEIRRLERILPEPPLPGGYWKGIGDRSALLEAFNSEEFDKILSAVELLAARLDECHLRSDWIHMLAESMKQHIEWLRGNLEKNAARACFDENEALLIEAIAYFERMRSNQWRIFQNARDKIREYDAAKIQCRLFTQELTGIQSVHRCLVPLVNKVNQLCASQLNDYFGEPFLNAFSNDLAPLMIRLRLLRQIINTARGEAHNRILMVHRNCRVNGNLIQLCRNRLAAADDGRPNPNWRDSRFSPLHFHTAGYSESLIYSWRGTECLFIHGIVSFHMDENMSAKQSREAREIEKLREQENDFIEYLVFGNKMIVSLDEIMSMTIDGLQGLFSLLPVK